VEYFSNEVALVAHVNQNILYEQINRVMTSEEAKDPDCECIFSSAVRLWWLTERNQDGDREGRCFKVSHNKISSTRCRQFFSLSNRCGCYILNFHRQISRYIFPVIVKSVNTLYSIISNLFSYCVQTPV
jgi:hypothetical protein